MSTALVLIDVQRVMFEPKPVFRADEMIVNICSLLEKARAAAVAVLFVQHQEKPGAEMAEGTPAWELHSAVARRLEETVLQKQTPDAFYQTSLHEELQKRGISHLVIAGFQTEYCVDTTCRRAFSLGYDVCLVADAHSTFDNEHLKATQVIEHHNMVLSDWFVHLKDSIDIKF